jgi:hypothetical protein
MLREAGFGRFETYGSLERDPFRLGSPSLLVVAEKEGSAGAPAPAFLS